MLSFYHLGASVGFEQFFESLIEFYLTDTNYSSRAMVRHLKLSCPRHLSIIGKLFEKVHYHKLAVSPRSLAALDKNEYLLTVSIEASEYQEINTEVKESKYSGPLTLALEGHGMNSPEIRKVLQVMSNKSDYQLKLCFDPKKIHIDPDTLLLETSA